jgi:hypothetical protein
VNKGRDEIRSKAIELRYTMPIGHNTSTHSDTFSKPTREVVVRYDASGEEVLAVEANDNPRPFKPTREGALAALQHAE